mgnify:CR=1 FL=1
MKKDRLLNPMIVSEIAALGHTEYLCIADCGLPIPKDVRVVDVSVTAGIPKFLELLDVVVKELVVESFIVATEIETVNPKMLDDINSTLPGIPYSTVSHEEFKKLTKNAKCVIRTGEISSYANIILIGGVNF